MKSDLSWRYSNFLLRVSLGLFLFLWGVDKIMAPADTLRIFEHFYKIQIGTAASTALGIAEMLLGIAIILGRWRTLSYGLGLFFHMISTLSSWRQLLDPWGTIWNQGKNSHLFLASIPVLAAFIVLFMNRGDGRFTFNCSAGLKK